MSMLTANAMTLLETRHDVLLATKLVGGKVVYDRSTHRQLAVYVADKAVKACDLSERWASGVPTQKELKQTVRRDVMASFGVLTWLIWGWRILSWIKTIREMFTDESGARQ